MKTSHKIIAAMLIVAAAAAHLLNSGYRDWNSGGDSAYVIMMLFLFFWREKVEDERVKELKLKAVTVAFAFGYALTFAVKLSLHLQRTANLPRGMSAFDFMFVVLVAAFALFHYWRWEDARPNGPS